MEQRLIAKAVRRAAELTRRASHARAAELDGARDNYWLRLSRGELPS